MSIFDSIYVCPGGFSKTIRQIIFHIPYSAFTDIEDVHRRSFDFIFGMK